MGRTWPARSARGATMPTASRVSTGAVKLMPLRICGAEDDGCPHWRQAKAFAYAGQKGAAVVNASLGGGASSLTVSNAIANAPNTLFVVAAGNEASNNDAVPAFPCQYPRDNIVCVAASTMSDDPRELLELGRDVGRPRRAGREHPQRPPADVVPGRVRLQCEQLDVQRYQHHLGLGGLRRPGLGGYLADSPDGAYLNNTDSFARISNSLNLTGRTGCKLTYFMRLDTEFNFDFLETQASTNGTTWTTLGGWWGSTGEAWSSVEDSLAAYDGQPSVHLRFHFHSDSSVDGEGADLDDVFVQCTTSPGHLHALRFLQGTSMATPHVAGAAALLKAHVPAATPLQIKAALLGGVDPKPAFAGITVTGGRLNLLNSINLIGPGSMPGAPTTVSATPGDARATVAWAPPASNGGRTITNYVITPYVGATAQTATTVGNVTTTQIMGLANGTSYTFTVAARNSVGTGPESTPSNLVTPLGAPGPPSAVTATGGDGQATVNWTAPAANGGSPVTGYVVTPFIGAVAQTSTNVGNATSTTVSGLVNGTTYTFRVAAKNALGTGAQSAASNAVTPAGAPGAPTARYRRAGERPGDRHLGSAVRRRQRDHELCRDTRPRRCGAGRRDGGERHEHDRRRAVERVDLHVPRGREERAWAWAPCQGSPMPRFPIPPQTLPAASQQAAATGRQPSAGRRRRASHRALRFSTSRSCSCRSPRTSWPREIRSPATRSRRIRAASCRARPTSARRRRPRSRA